MHGPRMNSIFKKANFNVEKSSICVRLPQNCFIIQLKVYKQDSEQGDKDKEQKAGSDAKPKARVQLSLLIGEDNGENGYEFIVDYKLVIDTQTDLIERDHWQAKKGGDNLGELLLDIKLDSCTIGQIELFLNVREMLAPQDLSVATSFRNFNILSAGRSFFVNANQLNALGGRMFKEWFERECQGEQNAVVQSLNTSELETLLQACCASTTPIVHRRNFDSLIEIADKERIAGLLRLLESYLIDSQAIHPIRKLEYAAEYRMSRLAAAVLKSFPNRLSRLDSLFAYLSKNEENITDVHLDVLEMLEIKDDHIIL